MDDPIGTGKIQGDGLCFYINNQALACETSCEFSMSTDMKAISPYIVGGGGFQHVIPGITSWQISVGANFITYFKPADFKTIMTAMLNKTPMQIAMHTGAGYSPSFFIGGDAYPNNLVLSSNNFDMVSYTSVFTGNGPLVFTSEAMNDDFWRIIDLNPAPADKPYYFKSDL